MSKEQAEIDEVGRLQVALEYGMGLYERAVAERRRLEEENGYLRTSNSILLRALEEGEYLVTLEDEPKSGRIEMTEIEGQLKLFVGAEDE